MADTGQVTGQNHPARNGEIQIGAKMILKVLILRMIVHFGTLSNFPLLALFNTVSHTRCVSSASRNVG